MEKLKSLFVRYRQMLAYLFFGGVTTAVNLVVYEGASLLGVPNGAANALAWVLSVLTAYLTNRRWVFRSRSAGREALSELAAFVGCRLSTGLLDEGIMLLAVDVIGPRWIAPARRVLWRRAMKLASNVLVIVLNYVFSKVLIFRDRRRK